MYRGCVVFAVRVIGGSATKWININQNGLNDVCKKLKENKYYEYMRGALTNNEMVAIMIFCDNWNVIYRNDLSELRWLCLCALHICAKHHMIRIIMKRLWP
eukprot:662279_1